jgi:hypothetical protein
VVDGRLRHEAENPGRAKHRWVHEGCGLAWRFFPTFGELPNPKLRAGRSIPG